MIMKRPILFVVIFTLAFLLQLYGRALFESRQALYAGEDAMAQGDGRSAAKHYTRALRWRAPGNPFSDEAQKQLEQCTFDKDCHEQAHFLEALHQGIFASRTALTIWSDNALIERIEHTRRELNGPPPIQDLAPPHWQPIPQLFGQIALWGWLVMTFLFIWRSYTPDGVRKKEGWHYGLGAVVCLFSWFLCLWLA